MTRVCITPLGNEEENVKSFYIKYAIFCNYFEFEKYLVYDLAPEQVFVLYRSDNRLQIPERKAAFFVFSLYRPTRY
jgi:hypothetical protein